MTEVKTSGMLSPYYKRRGRYERIDETNAMLLRMHVQVDADGGLLDGIFG